jgi:uncharacterized protein
MRRCRTLTWRTWDLHHAGTLLAAGPLRDRDRHYRGLSILRVGTDEARALKEAVPAVQAGLFRVVALPWMVPAGAVTFSRTHFPRSAAEALAPDACPRRAG